MTQDAALEILKSGANVFLTGEPGSGKTHTINAYIRYLRAHDVAVAVTASTGIAATHIGGMTIHSWSGVGIRKTLSLQELDDLSMREPLVKRMLAAKVLIIDEISMLDGKVFALVDQVARTLRRSDEPFGGLQVILVGDFFQLPPITKREEGPAQFSFMTQTWKSLGLIVCYLSEQHRQEDQTFLANLNAIRRAEIDESIYECLSERQVFPDAYPEDVPHLYTHNIDVDARNDAELRKLPGKMETFAMLSQGKPAMVEHMRKSCLSPEQLELKEGAVVMFTKNNFEAGYVNGTLGVVEDFDPDTGFPVVRTREGKVITATPAEWAIEEDGKVLARINQIPLRLAWAITVHKSQGMSMDAAIMDLSRAFEYGQGYVALSRVRTLSGLFLVGVNQRALEVHPSVLEQDRIFRDCSDEADRAFAALPPEELTLMQQNFLVASGGQVETGEQSRATTDRASGSGHSRLLTRDLLEEGKSVVEIIQIRGLTKGTILGHIETLLEQDPDLPIAHLRKEIPETLIHALQRVFADRDPGGDAPRLTELKRALPDETTFEEIRLARMFMR